MPETSIRIPGSTRVYESRVVHAPVDRVWEAVRPLTFGWLKTVKEVKVQEGSEAQVGSHRRVTYKDSAVQTYKVLELSDLEHFITYDVIACEPPVSVSSAIHTINLRRITNDKYVVY